MSSVVIRGSGRAWARWRQSQHLTPAATSPNAPILLRLPSRLQTRPSSLRSRTLATAPYRDTLETEADIVFTSPKSSKADKGKAKADGDAQAADETPSLTPAEIAAKFENLGLSTGLSQQLIETYPFIKEPTAAQSKLIPAVLAKNDVVVRAHTGSGKSFGILLSLMAKPRVSFAKEEGEKKAATGIASLIIVPTNELAEQYLAWAKTLLPPSIASSLDSVIQAVVRGDQQQTPEQQVQKLLNKPPHILIATPRRALEILSGPQGSMLLGLSTLQTLVLDEADALLDLPGRFPSAKVVWKNMVHPAPGLRVLNEVMKLRGTFSGGQAVPSAGLEPSSGKRGDEVRPPEKYRRIQHQANERLHADESGWLTPPKILKSYEKPLQLVACSATSNAVLRHFLGAKTGWLRLGIKQYDQDILTFGRRSGKGKGEDLVTGRWIDLTGLSGMTALRHREEQVDINSSPSIGKAMPVELKHACIIIDESLPPQELEEGQNGLALLPPMRNFSQYRVRSSLQVPDLPIGSRGVEQGNQRKATDERKLGEQAVQLAKKNIVKSYEVPGAGLDMAMLDSLAYTFALQDVTRGLVFIPPQWSLRNVVSYLEKLGLPLVSLEELRRDAAPPSAAEAQGDALEEERDPKVSVIQATSGRGLDLPNLSHVFILGIEAVGDAIQYAHLAGRTSRIGNASSTIEERKSGTVISFVRGLCLDDLRMNEDIALKWGPQKAGGRGHRRDGRGKSSTDEKIQSISKRFLISAAEKRMSTLYARLGVKPVKVELDASRQGISLEEEEEGEDDEGGEEELGFEGGSGDGQGYAKEDL